MSGSLGGGGSVSGMVVIASLAVISVLYLTVTMRRAIIIQN